MNKQEAIEKAKEYGEFYSNAFGGTVKMVPVGPIIDIISQIHEPQKVVVPKFVAEWIEHCKQSNLDLDNAMRYTRVNNAETGAEEWIYMNQETFARAWLDGYEVEKEKLYVVNLGKIVGLSIYLRKTDKSLYPNRNDWSTTGDIRFAERLTETEIKQKDERLWQFAEPVEVE
ncbi:TPA: DUF1642 domain-containing protein [Streptococcus suis]|nr:DUF1642 domain-containing protein [Streptococcus suis]HEM3717025.1 DUF1642 domain-containing protein [Streptococcus suis]